MSKVVPWMVLAIMISLSVSDLRHRKIPCIGLVIWGVLVVVCQVKAHAGGDFPDSLLEILPGIGVGMLFICISRITREAIGYGDSVAIVILGGFLGFWRLLESLAGAFFLCGIWSIGVCMFRRKKSIPFMPFLTAGYAILLIEQGGAL